jgi:flagellum-specific peptidoglycan hydrolase FlgJ
MPLSPLATQRAVSAGTALLSAGLPPTFLALALAQIAHETAGFWSRVMEEDNNLSGIMYIGKPDVQRNATPGRRFPASESSTARYAHFDTVKDWARDYIRIISRGAQPPIAASDAATLAQRLKANGYYTDTVSNYTAALVSWMPQAIGIAQTAQKKSPGVAC